jgi:hypothetical protein
MYCLTAVSLDCSGVPKCRTEAAEEQTDKQAMPMIIHDVNHLLGAAVYRVLGAHTLDKMQPTPN